MNYAVFFGGFTMAVLAILLLITLWIWAKAVLEGWSYNLMRESHARLREAGEKLDLIQRDQERLLSRLERLERAINELGSRLSQPKSAP
jgi:hypothetical protein